jgi:autotransporter-associated beta strand protein
MKALTFRHLLSVAFACVALCASLSLPLHAEPVEQLSNPDFDSFFMPVGSTNSYGLVSGSFPTNWFDNSRYTGKHVDNRYAAETNEALSGLAFRVATAIQSGYSSGANFELYQPFQSVSQRTYTASVSLKGSASATASLVVRQRTAPYTVRAVTSCPVTTTWQTFSTSYQAPVTESIAVYVTLAGTAMTLWIDEAGCKVQDGNRAWFMSSGGSDANAGSLGSPFLSFARAFTNLNAGDTLFLRGGIYRETLAPTLSGTRVNPIAITAYQAEPVTLSGCDVLAGPWSLTSNGIYSADAPATLGSGYNQVFADGEMQHEARHPDFGSSDLLNPATASFTVSSNYTVACSAFDAKGDLTGARFYAGVGLSWAWQNAVIASNRTGMLFLNPATVSSWWWPNYANKSSDTGRGFVYGRYSLLDADGEWFLQTNAAAPHTLHLRLAGAADPTGHVVEMKRRNWCVDINGQNFIAVSNLAFRAGAVRLNGAGLSLRCCDARFLSHFQTFWSGSAANGGRAEGSGIIVSGTSNLIHSCTISDTAGSGILVSGTGHLITRTRIWNTDYSATYGTGMTLDGVGNTASFNTLHDTGRDLLHPTGKGNLVLFNELYHAGRLCKDLGAIYAWGTNAQAPDGTVTRIAFNWVHDSTANDPLGMGIYLDNYSRHFQIDHNVVWNFGDTSTLTWTDGLRLNAPGDDINLYHNTLFRCRNYNYDTYTPYIPGSNTADNAYWPTNHHLFYVAWNNLYMTNAATELENADLRDFRPKSPGAALDPVCVSNTIAWTTTNGVLNVPSNYRLAMTYRYQPFSFLEQGGVGATVDTDGDQQPDAFAGATPDSGAYERGASYWTPGVSGWTPECPGVWAEQPFDYVGTSVTAKGHLLSAGAAPSTVLLNWGAGTNATAWANTVVLGTGLTGTFLPLFCTLTNIDLYATYGYLFHATNACGESWSDPITFTTGSGLPLSLTWDAGGGTNRNVDATNNWDAETVMDFNGAVQATFGTAGSTALINRAVCFYGIAFNRGANFTLADGNGALSLRGGGLSVVLPSAVSRTHTLAANVTLVDPQTWFVTNNGAGSASLDVTGVISDGTPPGDLAKTGDGTLTLKAANTYQGVTTVSNGTLAITHAQALGSTFGATVVRSPSGGRLQVSGGIVVAEPLVLNGERPNFGYSLYNSGGSNVWSGPVTRVGSTRINVAWGSTLVLTGGASGGGGTFVVNASGVFVVAEKPLLIGSNSFWTDSAGLTVLGVSGNVWGETILGNGTLRTDAPNALPASTKLKMGVDYAAGATLNLNGRDQTVAQFFTNTTTAGVRVITSALPATLTVSQAISTNFDGFLTGAVRLCMAGTGTLTLSGTNSTSTGGAVVSNGTLAVTGAKGIGPGPVFLCGGTLRCAVPAPGALAVGSLTWFPTGTVAVALGGDGTCGRLALSAALARGAGGTLTFDFGNTGAPNKTYTLMTFASTSLQASDFRCRKLGAGTPSVLQGEFAVQSNALTLHTFFSRATCLLVK